MEENKTNETEMMQTEENTTVQEDAKGGKKKKEKKPRVKWKDLPLDIRKKKRKKYIIIGVVTLVLFFMIVSKITAANIKMPVTTVATTIGDVEATISTSGTVESDLVRTYYSEISANVGTVEVKQGQAVKKGDVLLYFEEQSLSIAEKEAQAAALSSEGNYNDTMKQNAKTQAKLTEATVNLEVLEQQITDYTAFVKMQEEKYADRYRAKKMGLSALGMELNKKEASGVDVTDEMIEYQYMLETLEFDKELEDIQNTINEAQEILGNLEEYKAEMKSQKAATEDGVMSETAKEAQKVNNEATQLRNRQVLDYTEAVKGGLKADMAGVVTAVNVSEGTSVLGGATLVTVASNEQVHVTVNLSKTDLAKVKEGQRADVTVAGKKYEGEVSFVNRMATPNSNGMPVVEAQISITNADEDIYLGVEAKIVIYAQKAENALLVPVEAVNSDKYGDFVYTVENGIVVRKEVVTGVSSDEYVEIVSGLKEEDQVMTDISLGITEGMEVMALPAEGSDMNVMDEMGADDSAEVDDDTDVDGENTSAESE